MLDPSQLIVGLEIGTSKVCAAVGDIGPRGEVTVLGIGQAKSRGVRKGEITDAGKAAEDVRHAIAEAEDMANVEIQSLYLAVTGTHIRCVNSKGVQPIVSVDRTITREDVQDAIRNAKLIGCPNGFEVVDSVRQDFLVDDRPCDDPVGAVGARVEACVHVIHGHTNRIATARKMIEGLELSVEKPVFGGLASALAVLTPEQKEMGAVVIDLGAGTTGFAFFHGGVLRHSGVIAVGGDHVSNDLAAGLKVPMSQAEDLKVKLGSALVDPAVKGAVHSIARDNGLPPRNVNLEHLHRIMHLRLDETLRIVANELAPHGGLALPGAGVFLCGGGARTPELERLAEEIFQLPVGRAHVQNVSGPADVLANPEFATAIGLVRYGSMREQRKPRSRFDLRTAFTGIFNR
jgi:cell division protein FtsA